MSHKDSDVAEFSRFVKLKYVMAKFAAFCKNNIEYVVMAIGVVVILTAAITTIYGLLNVGVAAILVIVGVAAILVIVAVIVYDRLNCR